MGFLFCFVFFFIEHHEIRDLLINCHAATQNMNMGKRYIVYNSSSAALKTIV